MSLFRREGRQQRQARRLEETPRNSSFLQLQKLVRVPTTERLVLFHVSYVFSINVILVLPFSVLLSMTFLILSAWFAINSFQTSLYCQGFAVNSLLSILCCQFCHKIHLSNFIICLANLIVTHIVNSVNLVVLKSKTEPFVKISSLADVWWKGGALLIDGIQVCLMILMVLICATSNHK